MEEEAVQTNEMSAVMTCSRHLKRLRERKQELEDELKEINAQIANYNNKLAEEMVNLELQRFSLEGTLYYLATDIYVSDIAPSREELHEVVRQQGFGDLIKQTIHPSTLKGFVKEQIKENGGEVPEWLEPYVRVYEQNKVKMMNEK